MYTIGIDLGGTNIAAGVVDENHGIIGRSNLKTRLPRPQDEIMADLSAAAKLALDDAGVTRKNIKWIGVGSPGAADPERGVILYASSLKFTNADIRSRIERDFGAPCFVENDANAAAVGEYLAGAGRGERDFVAITLGTGIGAGVFVDGRLMTGFNHAGGEIGHMVIKLDGGVRCTCGLDGCFEMCCSATALKRETIRAMERDRGSVMWALSEGDTANVSGRTAFEATQLSDKSAKIVIDEYIRCLATGLINVVNIFQPAVICIGGGVGNAPDEYLLDPVRELVAGRTYGHSFLPRTRIVHAALGNDAGIIGAAGLGHLAGGS